MVWGGGDELTPPPHCCRERPALGDGRGQRGQLRQADLPARLGAEHEVCRRDEPADDPARGLVRHRRERRHPARPGARDGADEGGVDGREGSERALEHDLAVVALPVPAVVRAAEASTLDRRAHVELGLAFVLLADALGVELLARELGRDPLERPDVAEARDLGVAVPRREDIPKRLHGVCPPRAPCTHIEDRLTDGMDKVKR